MGNVRSLGVFAAVATGWAILLVAVRWMLLGGIRLYQRAVSPWLGPVCRFHPSCSCYGYEAIEHHGVLRGLALLVRRLLRCHPFHPGGFDPVPQSPAPCPTVAESAES